MYKYFIGAENSDESTKIYSDKYLKIGDVYKVKQICISHYVVEISTDRWFYFPINIFVDSYTEYILRERIKIIEKHGLK